MLKSKAGPRHSGLIIPIASKGHGELHGYFVVPDISDSEAGFSNGMHVPGCGAGNAPGKDFIRSDPSIATHGSMRTWQRCSTASAVPAHRDPLR
jgi:hypothetical protein